MSHNLTAPLREIIKVLRSVRHGVFDRKVRVTSNDEIGYTVDVINEMNEGLMERDFIETTFGKYVSQVSSLMAMAVWARTCLFKSTGSPGLKSCCGLQIGKYERVWAFRF